MKIDGQALKESISDTVIATPLNLLINYVVLAILLEFGLGAISISIIMTTIFFIVAIVRKYYVRTWFKRRQGS